MASRLRLATRQSGLHEATLVGAAGLAGILIAEMNFDPGDLIAEPAESVVDLDLDSVRQFVTALNVVIRVDWICICVLPMRAKYFLPRSTVSNDV